jgi:signal transduction histidine kinase
MSDVHTRVVGGLEAATLLVEGDGRVVFCNGAAVGLLGRDLAGVSLSTGDFDDDLPFVATLAARYRAAAARRAPLRELLAGSEGGELRFFWAVSSPAGGPAGKSSKGRDEQVLLILDVTETLSASATVRKVFSQVNHDLRSPLTSIAGAAELLQSGRVGELEGMQKRLITIVEEGARKMAEILAATKARLADRQKTIAAGEEAR